MQYRISWPEWQKVPLEKKIEFWKANDVDYLSTLVDDGEGGRVESSAMIPTIIEMINYLDRPENETLCSELWEECQLRLNLK
jgi:hypothetical protein